MLEACSLGEKAFKTSGVEEALLLLSAGAMLVRSLRFLGKGLGLSGVREM